MSPILGILASGYRAPSGSFESIATAYGTGSSRDISFSSIPSTYSHLQLRIVALGTAGAGGYPTSLTYFRLNSDSTASYNIQMIYGQGSGSAVATNSTNTGDFLYLPGSNSSIYSTSVIDIFDYANPNKKTVLRSLSGCDTGTGGGLYYTSMLWNKTDIVDSITLQGDPTYNGNWTTGSVFALYGIKG